MPRSSPGQLSIFSASPSKLTDNQAPEADDQMHEGYSPGHPSYYKLGGRVLSVDEIKPAKFKDFDPIHRTRSGKPRPTLEVQLETAKQELQRDIDRYKQLIEDRDKACSNHDLRMGYGAKFYLFLKHNHISYNKGLICKLEETINQFDF